MTLSMTTLWLVALIVFGVVEILTIDLVSIWFAFGALIALLLSFFKVKLLYQILAFIITSIIAAIVTRPLARKLLRGEITKTNYDRLIGMHAIVTREISEDVVGEVKVAGSYWSAFTKDNSTLILGEHVEVIAIEGVKLLVKKL